MKHDKQEMKNRKQRKSSANRKTVVREKENKKRSNLPVVPPVRSGGTINVTHTPRVFPSPARESTQMQEQQVSFVDMEGRHFSSVLFCHLFPTRKERNYSKLLYCLSFAWLTENTQLGNRNRDNIVWICTFIIL